MVTTTRLLNGVIWRRLERSLITLHKLYESEAHSGKIPSKSFVPAVLLVLNICGQGMARNSIREVHLAEQRNQEGRSRESVTGRARGVGFYMHFWCCVFTTGVFPIRFRLANVKRLS